jgi:hypothetical protein
MDDLPHETLWRLWSEQYDMDSDEADCSIPSRSLDDSAMSEDQALHVHAPTNSDDSKQNQCNSVGFSESKIDATQTKGIVEITSDPIDVTVPTDGSVNQPPSPALTTPSAQSAQQERTTEKSTVRSLPVRFLIHAKHPERVQSPWVKERLVSFQLRPGWGSLELTEVMVRMLSEVTSACGCLVLNVYHDFVCVLF